MNTKHQSTSTAAPWSPSEVFVLAWRKDAAGYDFSAQGGSIVRRRGRMVPAPDPETVAPPLHYTFANLRGQVWESAEGDFPGTDGNAPFHMRRFRQYEDALLEFVREYGFLGSANWGDDAPQEPLSYTALQQFELSVFMAFGYTTADGAKVPDFEMAARFNKVVPPLSLQLVRAPAGGYRLALQPQSLIAWMWLRAARDFASGNRYDIRECVWCGNKFTVGVPRPGVRRALASFCSDNCRKSQWRSGKAKRLKGRKK